jgi:hypothetical protein
VTSPQEPTLPDLLGSSNVPRKGATFAELGRTGLRRWQNNRAYLDEEFLPQLQGQRAIQTYREMALNDPVVGAGLHVIDFFMRKIEWRVEAFEETEQDRAAADFVEQCLDDMEESFEDYLSEIMSMVTYGWSFHEILYKPRTGEKNDARRSSRFDDGLIGWAGFPIRGQDTLNGWEFDPNTHRLVGMRQLSPPDYTDIVVPMDKALLFRTQVRKQSPEGLSILRRAYRPYFFKQRFEEIQGIGVERDLAGLPVAYVPPSMLSATATENEKKLRAILENLVRNIRRDKQEGVVFPMAYDVNGKELYKFELLSTGGARQFNSTEIIQQYDSRIAMTMLADFLLLGQTSVGSWALSSDKVNLFAEGLRAWANIIAAQFNRHAIPKLFKLNRLGTDRLPKLIPGEISAPPLAEIGQYITSLSGSGFPLWPNRELEDHLLEVARLPTPNEAERAEREREEALRQEQELQGYMGPDEDPAQPQQAVGPNSAKAQSAPQGMPRSFSPPRPPMPPSPAQQARGQASSPVAKRVRLKVPRR